MVSNQGSVDGRLIKPRNTLNTRKEKLEWRVGVGGREGLGVGS